MKNKYYYEKPVNNFKHIKFPSVLIYDKYFGNLSIEARLLYSLLLDRVSLSAKNNWKDDEGRIFIIYKLSEVQREFGCSDKKATRLFNELKNYGLIEKHKTGKGRPDIIYVKDIFSVKHKYNVRFNYSENYDSAHVNLPVRAPTKIRGIYTKNINTENNPINLINEEDFDFEIEDILFLKNDRENIKETIKDNIHYEYFLDNKNFDIDIVNEAVEIMTDTYCTTKNTVHISGDNKPVEVVRSVLLKIDRTHIEYVLNCLENTTTKIKNIRGYLLAAVYNAPSTIDTYYRLKVNYDTKIKQIDNKEVQLIDVFGLAI